MNCMHEETNFYTLVNTLYVPKAQKTLEDDTDLFLVFLMQVLYDRT